MTISQEPDRVAARLKDVVIDFGLRRATATTDTHTVTVEEPSIWEDGAELKTEIKEHDL
jgi:hypothetical protein